MTGILITATSEIMIMYVCLFREVIDAIGKITYLVAIFVYSDSIQVRVIICCVYHQNSLCLYIDLPYSRKVWQINGISPN